MARQQGDFTVESLAEALCQEYNITPENALSDVGELTVQWLQVGVVQEESSRPNQNLEPPPA